LYHEIETMSLEEERELLVRIKSDRKEFGVLFDYYYKPIFSYLYRRTGTYELARDMAAETFLKAFLKIEKFAWRHVSIRWWLYRIATNEANQFYRRKRYTPTELERLLDFDLARQADSEDEKQKLDAELKQHEEFLAKQHHLKKLDTRYQDVISLKYFEGKDNREIGLILGKKEGTVKSLVSRALEKLRKMAGGS
jgi:RNA polymerase sigma-70 factor (ECF subfamily)